MTLTAGAPAAPFVPPMQPFARPDAGGVQVLLGLGRNAWAAFPRRCTDEGVVRLPLPVPGAAVVVASAPDAIRQVLADKADLYGRLRAGKRVLQPIVGRGLLVSEGEAWRRQRRAMAPAFTPRAVPVLARHIATCAEASCRALEAARGRPVDLLDATQRLALHIAAASMFALEADTFGAALRGMMSGYMATIGRPTPADFLLPAGVPTPRGVRRALFHRRWRRLVRTIIAARRERDGAGRDGEGADKGAPRDLFDLMAAAHGERDEDLLADEAATMIVAGHETTALVLFWSCYLLARAPQWQDLVAAEARELDLSPDGAAASLPALRHTRAVVQEALRLFPPAFLTARQARAADVLCGVAVPRGAVVLMPFWLLHRNPRWWGPDANAFDPGRFLCGPEPDRWAFLPFGAGPHVCIGAQLAMAEAVLVLARLLRGSTVSLPHRRPVLPVGTLTTRPDHAPFFVLHPR